MPYIAHVGIALRTDTDAYKKGQWYHIKIIGNIEYRWRLNHNLLYEMTAGVFNDKREALKCAKQMYVTLIFSILKRQLQISDAGCNFYEQRLYISEKDGDYESYNKEEKFFFWNPQFKGGLLGPGVYEVEKSVDDFDTYEFLSATLKVTSPDTNLNFENIDEYVFTYCREAQQLLSTVVLADSISEYGMKMTLYCGLLEHLAIDCDKEISVIAEIDRLIRQVQCSELSAPQKDQLVNFLNSGKGVSSRQKCRTLIDRCARKKYSSFTAKQVFDEAYGHRSTFSHGDEISYDKIKASQYMKYLVLDIIERYFFEKELT